jgi:L-seryl-tRNA(Ser) seleniumtransferase
MLDTDPAELQARAAALAGRLAAAGLDAVAVPSTARIGGGGAPEFELPSAAVSLPAGYAEPLRRAARPVVGHLADGRTLLDLRSVLPEQDADLGDAVLAVRR